MLTSRGMWTFRSVPANLCISKWNSGEVGRFLRINIQQQQQRGKCSCMNSSTKILKTTAKQALLQTMAVRGLSSSSCQYGPRQGVPEPPPPPEITDDYVDLDLEADMEDRPPPRPTLSGSRVKVKFSWKNALVSADARNLLENLYQTHPQLVEFDENSLVLYLQMMSQYAIHVEKAAEMVIINPTLLTMPEKQIADTITVLRGVGINETQRSHVLRSVPQVFNATPKRLASQFGFLKSYFTTPETVEVVCRSVETAIEPISILRQKLEYLIKDMSHETPNIVKCKCLSYSLRHIKTRHEFLIRAGLFVPIPYRKMIKVMEKEYKDRNKPRNKYFKPMQVVCYKDEDFLKECTGNLLTLNEYAAFEELYGAELEVLKEEQYDKEDEKWLNEGAELDDEDEEIERDAVSLVKNPNSGGFLNDVESKSCYF